MPVVVLYRPSGGSGNYEGRFEGSCWEEVGKEKEGSWGVGVMGFLLCLFVYLDVKPFMICFFGWVGKGVRD